MFTSNPRISRPRVPEFSALIFRFFDITKIYPINNAEKLSGAKGVIMDDIIAGIYSLIIIMFYKIVLFFWCEITLIKLRK